MQVNQKTYATVFLSCLAISICVLSGCRAGGFQKPDLGKLTFWKNQETLTAAKDSPPPPARQFDPSPIEGESSSTEIVEMDNKKLKNRFNNDIEQMRVEIKEASKALGEPIRKPYVSETAESKSDSGNRYPLAFNNPQSKLEEFDVTASSGLNAAQNDFQAAMNNAIQPLKNDFSAKAASTALASGLKTDNGLPAGFSPTKSLADVGQAIDEANSKLVSNLNSAAKHSQFQQADDFQNSFQPNSNVVKRDNVFQAPMQNKMVKSFSPENGFAASVNDETPKTQPNQKLELMQAQIMEAKQQIEELKQQVALAGRRAATTPATIGNMKTVETTPSRTAQLFDAPEFSSSYAARSQTEPSNVLRPANQSIQPQTLVPLSPQVDEFPNYASTPHGEFSPQTPADQFGGNFSPLSTTPASQVNFQKENDEPMVATANDAPESPSGFDGEIQNHVSEVDIPDSVLRGNGSYAPGSVQPLN